MLTEIPRGRKRMMELMMKAALSSAPINPVQMKQMSEATKEWHLMFLRSPNKFFAKKDSRRVCLIQFGINQLEEVRSLLLCIHCLFFSQPSQASAEELLVEHGQTCLSTVNWVFYCS